MFPSSIIYIITTVFIFKDKLVDRLRSIIELVDKGFPEIIFKRAFGFISNGDSYTSVFVIILNIISAKEQEIFVILFDYGRSP